MTQTKRIYRTSDGKIFDNESDAVTHAYVSAFNKFGEFGHFEKIDRSDDSGKTWH